MDSEHPGRAAAAATLVALFAIGVLGNQWIADTIDEAEGGRGHFLRLLSPFRWRVSGFPDSNALKLGPYVAIVVTVALVAVLVVPVAKRCSGFGLLAATIGVTLVASFVGAVILGGITYGSVFGNGGDPRGEGRILWSLNNAAPAVSLWALLVGALGGLLAVAVAGARASYRAATPEPWGGQGVRGPNDTQAMWIPTQAGGTPAAGPSWEPAATSTGWEVATPPGADSTVADLPPVGEAPRR